MKYLKLISLLGIVALNSCKKENAISAAGTSLTIINAVVGSYPLVTNFSNEYTLPAYSTALQISYGAWNSNYQFSAYSGEQTIMLYQMPDTTDHSAPLYNLQLDLPVGSIQSLFLTGKVTQPDTLFITDYPPYHPDTDSSVGIRFINLSPGSKPVDITLSTSTTIKEFSGVQYKGVTKFKNYPVIASVSSYNFQIRDVGTNAIIATRALTGINNGTGSNRQANQYRYRNITILLIGQPGATGAAAQKTLVVNNY